MTLECDASTGMLPSRLLSLTWREEIVQRQDRHIEWSSGFVMRELGYMRRRGVPRLCLQHGTASRLDASEMPKLGLTTYFKCTDAPARCPGERWKYSLLGSRNDHVLLGSPDLIFGPCGFSISPSSSHWFNEASYFDQANILSERCRTAASYVCRRCLFAEVETSGRSREC